MVRRSASSLLVALVAAACSEPSGPFAERSPASPSLSSVALRVGSVAADGTTPATVTVRALDDQGAPIPGALVGVTYASGATVTPASPTTDATGTVEITITSETPTADAVDVSVDGVVLGVAPVLAFHDCEYRAFVDGACAPPKMIRLDPALPTTWGGVAPRRIAVADMDGNGLADVAVADPDGQAIQVLVALGDGTFSPRWRHDAGAAVQDLVVADVTGDAIQDVVTVANGRIEVLPGVGDGTLREAVPQAEVAPAEVGEAADLDADGDLDLVTRIPGGVGVALNDGAGAFPAHVAYAATEPPQSTLMATAIAVGDLDGDERPDVAAVFGPTSEVVVRLGAGGGALGPPAGYPTGTSPSAIALADLDEDGRIDVVTANYGAAAANQDRTVSVLLGGGDGSLGVGVEYPTGPNPVSIVAADLDRDGHADVVTADANGASATVLLGDGSGHLARTAAYEAGQVPRQVVVARIDRDALPDLVALDGAQGVVRGIRGLGDGRFAAPRFGGFVDYSGPMAVADVGGDGVKDVITAPFTSGIVTVAVAPGRGDGTLGAATTTTFVGDPGSGVAVAAGDLDGDGRADLVVPVTGDNAVGVLLAEAHGTLTFDATYAVGNGPAAAAIGDVDGDGDADVVVADGAWDGGTVTVLLGDGLGAFSAGGRFTAGGFPRAVALADLDADGDLDAVIGGASGWELRVMKGDGAGSFTLTGAWGAGSASFETPSVAVADLDGDGHLDAVATDPGGHRVGVFFGVGDGTFSERVTHDVGMTPNALALGDVDGDTLLDVVTADVDSGTVTLLRGAGGGSFAAGSSHLAREAPRTITAARMDCDALDDVVLQTVRFTQIMPGTADGLEGWTPLLLGRRPSALASGDLDGDGVEDVVAVSSESASLGVALGLGHGGFARFTPYGIAGSPTEVAVGDLDGDGHPDLAVTHVSSYDGTSTVGVLLGRGDGTFDAEVTRAAGTGGTHLALGDVDGDGTLDVAVSGTPSASLLRGNGDGTFADPVALPTAPGSIPGWATGTPTCVGLALGDLDGDGTLDVITSNRSTDGADRSLDEVAILLGAGSGAFEPRIALPAWYPYRPVVADLDGDGDRDVVATSNGAVLTVLVNAGDGTFEAVTLQVPMSGISAAAADLDLDGDDDLVTVGWSGLAVHRNEGGLAFDSFTFLLPVQVASLVLADLDGDGRPDVVPLGQGSGALPLLNREP